MSLKSLLTGKTEKDKQFQDIIKNIINPKPLFTTVSGKKPFSDEYEELVPYTLSTPYFSTIVGMGFDYLARFMVAKNLQNPTDKKSVCKKLVAEHGLKKLERMTDKKVYKVLNKKFEEGIEVCERFINNKKSDFDEIINFSGYLAALEAVSRSGLPPLDIKKSLIDDTETEIINDLRGLCSVFESRFINSGILKGDDDVLYNPNFGIGSMCCGGADADIFLNGTLYDFKCSKSRGYKWTECAQIVGYYILHLIDLRCGGSGMAKGIDFFADERSIDRLAFYRSRYGEIETFDVSLLDRNKVEQGIEKLRKMWDLKFV